MGETAQSGGLLDIGVNFSVDLLAFRQRGKAEAFQIIKAKLRRDQG